MINGFDSNSLNSNTNDDGTQIDSRHPSYIAMTDKYRLINTILGGYTAMRDAGLLYLPQFTNESPESYKNRLGRTYLDPSFSVAVESHSAKPFSRPIVLEGLSDDPRLSGLHKNTDGEGNDVTEFAKRVFVDGDQYGMSHILADYTTSTATSKADEAGDSARLVHVRCLDLFYWDKDASGLSEIRYHRAATVAKGAFGKQQVRQIVRWRRDSWDVWQASGNDTEGVKDSTAKDEAKIDKDDLDSGQWKMVDSGKNSLGFIPLTTVYFKRKGFMESEPPNMELAEVTLEHYQDMSDQKSLEKVSRVALMTASGYDPKELDGFSVSALNLLESTNPEAKFQIIEHTGSAVAIGRGSLKILEDKMEELSLKPELNRTSGDVTASEVISNAFNSQSDLMSWTNAVEEGMREAFRMAYKYIDKEVDDLKLCVYKDFTIVGNVSDLSALTLLYTSGALDAETLLFEFKRRGSLDITHDIKEIIERASAEAEKKMQDAMTLAQASKPEVPSESNSTTTSSKSE